MAQNKINTDTQVSKYIGNKLTRHDFPEDFIFGAATSAYQVFVLAHDSIWRSIFVSY